MREWHTAARIGLALVITMAVVYIVVGLFGMGNEKVTHNEKAVISLVKNAKDSPYEMYLGRDVSGEEVIAFIQNHITEDMTIWTTTKLRARTRPNSISIYGLDIDEFGRTDGRYYMTPKNTNGVLDRRTVTKYLSDLNDIDCIADTAKFKAELIYYGSSDEIIGIYFKEV